MKELRILLRGDEQEAAKWLPFARQHLATLETTVRIGAAKVLTKVLSPPGVVIRLRAAMHDSSIDIEADSDVVINVMQLYGGTGSSWPRLHDLDLGRGIEVGELSDNRIRNYRAASDGSDAQAVSASGVSEPLCTHGIISMENTANRVTRYPSSTYLNSLVEYLISADKPRYALAVACLFLFDNNSYRLALPNAAAELYDTEYVELSRKSTVTTLLQGLIAYPAICKVVTDDDGADLLIGLQPAPYMNHGSGVTTAENQATLFVVRYSTLIAARLNSAPTLFPDLTPEEIAGKTEEEVEEERLSKQPIIPASDYVYATMLEEIMHAVDEGTEFDMSDLVVGEEDTKFFLPIAFSSSVTPPEEFTPPGTYVRKNTVYLNQFLEIEYDVTAGRFNVTRTVDSQLVGSNYYISEHTYTTVPGGVAGEYPVYTSTVSWGGEAFGFDIYGKAEGRSIKKTGAGYFITTEEYGALYTQDAQIRAYNAYANYIFRPGQVNPVAEYGYLSAEYAAASLVRAVPSLNLAFAVQRYEDTLNIYLNGVPIEAGLAWDYSSDSYNYLDSAPVPSSVGIYPSLDKVEIVFDGCTSGVGISNNKFGHPVETHWNACHREETRTRTYDYLPSVNDSALIETEAFAAIAANRFFIFDIYAPRFVGDEDGRCVAYHDRETNRTVFAYNNFASTELIETLAAADVGGLVLIL